MPKLGTKGAFHTVDGDCLAFVVATEGGGSNPDDDIEVVIFPPRGISADTSLEGGTASFRYTHVNDQAGGFTPFGK